MNTSIEQQMMQEVIDRCRRVETRLTRFLESQGFDTGSRRPSWRNGSVHVPSADCTIRDMLKVVPKDWDREEEIHVYVKTDHVFSFFAN